ncbi:MAG: hypothetical protein Q7K55_07460 [Candidatus Levybacteria bacterium]|nr:hypothetical protein [Candidatus Levybacteria bacterium]
MKKNFFLIFIFLFFIAFIVFRNLPQAYFQQDEWHSFGHIVLNHFNIIKEFSNNWFNYVTGNMRLMAISLNFLLFKMFGLNAEFYAFFAILFHALNSFLIFYLIYYIFKERKTAFLASLFFLLSSAHLQAFTWFGTISGTLPNATFSLLSLILFIKYLQTGGKRNYYLSIIFLTISVSFKESSAFLVLFYGVLSYLLRRSKTKENIASFLKSFKLLWGVSAVFVLIYMIPVIRTLFTGYSAVSASGGSAGNPLLALFYNLIFYPFETLSQVFIVSPVIFQLANELTMAKFYSLWGDELMRQTVMAEYMTVIASFLVLSIILLSYKYLFKKDSKERKILLISTFFILISVLPFIILPKGTSLLESRYYYLPSIGASVVFSLIVFGLWEKGKKLIGSRKTTLFIYKIGFAIIIIWYFSGHVQFTSTEIEKQVKTGRVRKEILSEIKNTYPVISKKSVFYTESDSYYYGPVSPTMPFQSGFGQMLIVLYSLDGNIDPKFNEKDFLWGIHDEGYKEIGDQGFGYYKTYGKLVAALKEHKLKPENIYAFRWKNQKLSKISSEIREKVEKEYAKSN